MCRRQTPDVSKSRCSRLLVKFEKQKIPNGQIVQLIRDCWMDSNAIQRVAEYQAISYLSVVERLDPKMVARAEQSPSWFVPNGESKVA